MPELSLAAIAHARICAELDAATTSDFAAASLNLSPDSARATLKKLAADGYLRPMILPGYGNEIIYQPTPKAVGLRVKNQPKHLRAGQSKPAAARARLRGAVRFLHRPELDYLTTAEQADLCRRFDVPTRGYARALLGRDSAGGLHVFVPHLPEEGKYNVWLAFARWAVLFDVVPTKIHFAGLTAAAAPVRLALADELAEAAALAELEILEAQVAADRSGHLAIRSASRMAELRELAAAPGLSRYLGGIIEV